MNVAFGNVFSSRVCTKEFTMMNKGRRPQTLTWVAPGQQAHAKLAATDNALQVAPSNIFEVVPNRFSLKPGAAQVISIRGFSVQAGSFAESLVCYGTFEKDPARKTIVEAQISATFITPVIALIPSSLQFLSAHHRDDDFETLSRDLTLQNKSDLPLHICFKCPPPYSLNPPTLEKYLQPNEILVIEVNFDPSYKTDRISASEHSKLTICYTEHPQRDFVELSSKVMFPNLFLSNTSVNFGCIPNNTEQRRTFTMNNTGDLPVHYSWTFLEDDRLIFRPGPWKGNVGNTVLTSDENRHLDIYKVFDIMPLHGSIEPGESQEVELTFYGHIDGLFEVVAMCDLIGGPKYEVHLSGESSSLGYKFDCVNIDFGEQLYQDVVEKDIVLSGTGKVAFDYEVIIPESSVLAQRINVSPASGSILPFEKQRLNIRFAPCIPETVNDNFFIRISHFAPVKINVKGTGVFPRISVALPKVADEHSEAIIHQARKNLGKLEKSKGPPTAPQSNADGNAGVIDIVEHNGILEDDAVEAEAARLLLKSKTLSLLRELNERATSAPHSLPPAGIKGSKSIGSPVLMQYSQLRVSKEKKTSSHLAELSTAHVATYLCDMGNIVRNTVRKKLVKVTNHGNLPVTFAFDRSVLVGTGFNVEPEKVKISPGSPTFETTDFTVSIATKNLDLGLKSVNLPLLVNGGPKYVITLRAFVTVPELKVSTDNIDFSDVICSTRKTHVLQFQNPNVVPCEWTSTITGVDDEEDAIGTSGGVSGGGLGSNAKGAGKAQRLLAARKPKDPKKQQPGVVKEFIMLPSSGTLAPGATTNVLVHFAPNDERYYDALVGIKINLNNKPFNIRLRGRGLKLTVQFEPESVMLTSILPLSDGADYQVVVYNPTDYPIELYSVDFDEQYLQEEEALRKCEGYENGVLHLPLRLPGAPLKLD